MEIITKDAGGNQFIAVTEYKPCRKLTACLYLGNDEFPRSYVVVASEIPHTRRAIINGQESESHDPEYVVFDEFSGRLSPYFIDELKRFLGRNYVEKVICISSNDDLRTKIRRECNIKPIYIENKKRDDCAVILQDWFKRLRDNGEPTLKIRENCIEARSFNYLPARLSVVYLLEYFERQRGKKVFLPKVQKLRAGYS